MRFLILFSILFGATAQGGEFDWVVSKSWTPSLEKKFSEFVRVIGESGCRTLTACLTSPTANPFYHRRTPQNRAYPADCADLPLALRMYFAWMEGLPFDYVIEVQQANPAQERGGDLRYSTFGNKPKSVRRIKPGQTYDFSEEFKTMRNSVSTATYRIHYDFVSDFYPPSIDRNGVVPGTIAYDPAGHAAIVYKVEADGRVRMMDAHPDNSITRITYDQKFVRSRPAHGAGLRNWRPELSTEPTAQLAGFSLDQFARIFQLGGESVDYYDWVRSQLAGGSLKFKPVEELKNKIGELCSNLQDREIAVRAAIQAGISVKPHPARLPINIFGTSGEWEEYSTPSRDARLKVAFVELRKEVERFVLLDRQGSARVEYRQVPSRYSGSCSRDDRGCFLVASLKEAYEDATARPECQIRYKKSDGATQALTYSDIVERLYRLSFDPYHCVEYRWGAQGSELSSCTDDRNKRDWYESEQRLRNQIERTYDTRMDFDLAGVATRLGTLTAPEVDVWGYLRSL